MMYLNGQKEEFSYAYIHAITSVAGYSISLSSRPMDAAGLDITIEAPGEVGEVLFPKLQSQVKCTGTIDPLSDKDLSYPLPVKTYNLLSSPKLYIPAILIVVIVPDVLSDWMQVDQSQMILRRCAYWVSLKGKEPSNNSTKVSVHLPRTNLLTPDSLCELMNKIAKGEDL